MDYKICQDVSVLGINVAFLSIRNIQNNFNGAIISRIRNFYSEFLENYTPDDLEKDPNILGYRELHKIIGLSDNSLVASPESLIKLLFKYKTLRPINYIVDFYNYIAIKNKISIGAHDLSKISGNVRLCLTKGGEKYTPLGKSKSKEIPPGEYCYIDNEDEILCRLDCRQSDKTKISENTSSCLFIVQGHKYIKRELLESTAKELQDFFASHDASDSELLLKII